MTSMPKCGALCDAVGRWDWVQMMSLYCQSSAADEQFIRELEVVPGIVAAVKTAEFLNENLWKDDKMIRKLRNMNIDAGMKADEMENFDQFLEELDNLGVRHVPSKMADFKRTNKMMDKDRGKTAGFGG
ncbi:hypothetical protein Tco_0156222 [Tanacetum coccineum]